MPKKRKNLAVVIVPTYNESENIGLLIDVFYERIFPVIDSWDLCILVIDANSPDGTASIVSKKIEEHNDNRIFLKIEENKCGIGAAYITGFSIAKDDLRADAVIEFDADFQHPPETVITLISKLDEGYDYVIGSRKIIGGSEPLGRNKFRRFFTDFGGFVARLILFFPGDGFWHVTDPTTGLKITRVKGALDRLELDQKHLYSRGFGYKVQLLSETIATGARYAEIPLKFENRLAGISKFEISTVADIIVSCIKTRFHDPLTRRFFRFAVVGFVGYLINAALLAILPQYIHIEWLIWFFATEMTLISNFTLNNIWTFDDVRITGIACIMGKFLQFNFTSFGSIIIQIILGTWAVHLFGPEYRELALPVIILVAVLPYNWFMYRKVIWNRVQTSKS